MDNNIIINDELKFLKQKIKDKIKEDNSSDLHQSLLNIGYNWWNENKVKELSYGDMINHVEKEYGEFVACMILLGKYNQQVCNGGHSQYYNNGYADGLGGCFSERDFSHPLHKKIIKFIKNLEPKEEIEILLRNKLYVILNSFQDAHIDTDEKIWEQEEYYDEEEEEYQNEEVEVNNDDYGQFINYDLIRKLDDDYYKINDYLLVWYNKLISNYLYR
jgi:hypothetical protein